LSLLTRKTEDNQERKSLDMTEVSKLDDPNNTLDGESKPDILYLLKVARKLTVIKTIPLPLQWHRWILAQMTQVIQSL
jgi:glutaredoxin 2